MRLFIGMILCGFLTYSLIDVYIVLLAESAHTSKYLEYIYKIGQFFICPIILITIYVIWSSKIIQRLNKTHFFTGIDMVLMGFLFGHAMYFKDVATGSYIRLCRGILFVYILWLGYRDSTSTSSVCKVTRTLYSGAIAKQDKLNRIGVAKQISDALLHSDIDASFVLAITAKWGDGKTTIMQFVKETLGREGNLIFYTFDPWYFNTQEALISSFFKSLYEQLNKDRVLSSYAFLFSKYAYLINGVSKSDVTPAKTIGIAMQHSVQIETLKTELEQCLRKVDKKVVVFIDNIDRLDTQELFLTFKLVNLCADFSNIIFVLLYDKKQVLDKMNEGHPEDFGKKYLEKIINAEIALPVSDPMLVQQYWNRLLSVTSTYTISLNEKDKIKYDRAIEYISELISNIRIAKNHINWITLKCPFYEENKLNYVDFFVLESISFFAPETYQYIFDNRQHFAYYAKYDFVTLSTEKKVNEIRQQIYAEMLIPEGVDKQKILKLLSLVFRAVRSYVIGSEDYWGGDGGQEGHFQDISIDNYRYIRAYFSLVATPELSLAVSLQDVLKLMGKASQQEAEDIFDQFVKNVTHTAASGEFIEYLRNSIETIDKTLYQGIIKALYSNSKLFSHDADFLSVAEYTRLTGLVALLLRAYEPIAGRLAVFKDLVLNADELDFVRGILHLYPETSQNIGEKDDDSDYEQVRQAFKNRVGTIINRRENIFTEPNRYRDFWGLVDFSTRDDIESYLNEVLEDHIESLPIFLNAFVQRVISSASGVYYEFGVEEDNRLTNYIAEEKVRSLVNLYLQQYASETKPRSIERYIAFKEKGITKGA